MSLTQQQINEVKKIVNEQVVFTTEQSHFTDLTISEKLTTLIKSSLYKLNTDSFLREWFKEPESKVPVLKNVILTDLIKPYLDIQDDYYGVVKIGEKLYVTNQTVSNIVLNFSKFSFNTILLANFSLPVDGNYKTVLPIQEIHFDGNGLLTKLPREAWVVYKYWLNKITGTNGIDFTATSNESITVSTGSGTFPTIDDNKSLIITLNSNGTPNPNKTYEDYVNKDNQYIKTLFNDYDSIKLIKISDVEEYIQLHEKLDYDNDYETINTELYSKIDKTIDIILSAPTISTWNKSNSVNQTGSGYTDNIAFYNPLLENTLNERFGYFPLDAGNGYTIVCSKDTNISINTESGKGGTIKEGTFAYSSFEGFLLSYGLKNIIASLNDSAVDELPISAAIPPLITAVRYIGGTLEDSIIQQGTSLPTSGKVDDLFINTSDRKIYRYTGTDWISVGGNDIFKEVGEERTYTERDIAIGKTEFDTDISYALDVSGLVNFNNQIRFNTNTDISINSNVSISGDLIVKGNYVIEGTTSSTNNISVESNEIILNQGLEEEDYIKPIESGIIINRAKNGEIPQEPFKIIYTDDRAIDDDYLNIGIGDNLQRVATIDASKNYMDGHLVYWNANEGRLDIETDISKNDSTLFVNKSIRTTGDIYNAVHQDISTSVFPHQDENADVGVWGILNKMFDQPPKFKAKSTDAKSTFFKVEWEKAFSSLRFSHNGTEVPHIEKIVIQIRQGGEWKTVDDSLSSSQTSYMFLTNGTYGDIDGIGGITISLNELYDVRIYGINLSSSTTYNYLLFEKMEIVPPAEPSAPRLVSFDSNVSFNYINVKYSAPKTFNIDIVGGEPDSDKPALENYKIIYKPEGVNGSAEFNTLRNNGNALLNLNEITVLAIDNLNYDAENIITKIQHSNATLVYPASRYVLKEVRAKNILNENYSANGVVPEIEIVITTPPPPVDYGSPVFPFFTDESNNIITEEDQATLITITAGDARTFNIGSTKIIDGNYINITTSNPTYSFGVTGVESGVYVNRDVYIDINNNTLGKNYVGIKDDTFVELYYNIDGTDVSYQRLYFDGFNENSGIGSVRYEPETTENDLDIYFNQEPFETGTFTSASGQTMADITYRGYGIYGFFRLLSQSNSIGLNRRFQPRSNVQKIGYRVKSFTVDTTRELSLYIDDLSRIVSLSNAEAIFIPKRVRYCYGIPSIGLFDISVNYTISNYASKFLPPDGIISDICLNPSPFAPNSPIPFSRATENIIRTDIEPSTNIDYVFEDVTMNIDVDRTQFIKFENAVRIRGYSMIVSVGPLSVPIISITNDKFIHNDATSFTSATSNEIQSFGQGVYKYDHTNRYTLELLSDLSSNNFILPNNQMIYFRGAFYSKNIYSNNIIDAFKDYRNYYGGGADHSGKSIIGDFYNGDNYKWLMKRVATNIPTNNDDARRRTIKINDINLSNIIDLPQSILVFVLQKYTDTDPDNTIKTYGSTQNYTIWYNARATFNSDSMSGTVNYDTDQLNEKVGIARGNSVDLYFESDSSKTWDIYVRIGVPTNNDFAITSISFE
jgi:hypothetical protein